MRTLNRILPLLGLLLFAGTASAATNAVLAGEDLQAKIDAAASGDVMVIQSAAYGGAITINKALTLVRSGAGNLQLLGPVTINTAGAVALSQLRFSDAVNITGGASVSVLESRFEGAVAATEGKLSLRRSEIVGPLNLNNTALTGLRLTNQSVITAISAANSGLPMNLAQSSFSGGITATGYAVSMGYSKAVSLSITDGDATVVGNQFSTGNGLGPAINDPAINGLRSHLKISNNSILLVALVHKSGIVISSCEATITNNTIAMLGGYVPGTNDSLRQIGIHVGGNSSVVRISGNIIIYRNQFGQSTQSLITRASNFDGLLEVSYCCFFPSTPDVPTFGSMVVDPGLVDNTTLAIGSACRNAGPPDAIYNDRDGTRNDIGYTGGPLYNPANYVTDLPLAFWLDATPRKVLKGVNNTIRVDAAATAGH